MPLHCVQGLPGACAPAAWRPAHSPAPPGARPGCSRRAPAPPPPRRTPRAALHTSRHFRRSTKGDHASQQGFTDTSWRAGRQSSSWAPSAVPGDLRREKCPAQRHALHAPPRNTQVLTQVQTPPLQQPALRHAGGSPAPCTASPLWPSCGEPGSSPSRGRTAPWLTPKQAHRGARARAAAGRAACTRRRAP